MVVPCDTRAQGVDRDTGARVVVLTMFRSVDVLSRVSKRYVGVDTVCDDAQAGRLLVDPSVRHRFRVIACPRV